MAAHDSTECSGCGWERHAQAFRWFPEMGPGLPSPREDVVGTPEDPRTG